MYKVIKEGSGDSPKAQDTVTVNYRGTLIDGTEFDSSVQDGQAGDFPRERRHQRLDGGVAVDEAGRQMDIVYSRGPRLWRTGLAAEDRAGLHAGV